MSSHLFEPDDVDAMRVASLEQKQRIDDSLKASLERHLTVYKSRLTKEEEEKFRVVTLEQVKAQILRIQEQQGREKKLINLTRMNTFLQKMSEWHKIVAPLTDISDLGAFLWGSVSALLEAANTFAESFDFLLDAYEQIGEALPSLEDHHELFKESQDMRNCLRLLYCDIMDFHFTALRIYSGQAWKRVFRSYWRDFETKFSGILKALQYHKDLLKEQAEHSLDRIRVQETRRKYDDLRDRLLLEIENRNKDERQRNYVEVKSWIAAPSPQHEHEQACAKRTEEDQSGEWIFQKPQIKEWKDWDTPDNSILWLHGIPGAGKTVLSSKIIEACESSKNSKTMYFYCIEKNPNKNTFTAIMKSLLVQALGHSRQGLLPLCHERQKKSSEVTLQSPKQTMTLLESCLLRVAQQETIRDQQKTHERQYIVIDGLDECETNEWQQLVGFFQRLLKSLGPDSARLRVLFISQHTNQIEKELNTTASIKISPRDISNDIEVYARRRSRDIGVKFGLDNNRVEETIKETCSGAAGMFLYARLVMDNLLDQPTKALFDEERAKQFPDGLSEAYERILQRIRRDLSKQYSPQRWELIRMLLGWLVCARRPLKWQEIQLACCIDSDNDNIDFEQDKLRVHIRDYCGSLIEAPVEKGNATNQEHELVRFVHNTTSRYLVVTGFVNELLAEASLTTKCVRYISLPCFDENLPAESLLRFSLLGYYIFQDYAVSKWAEHFVELLRKAGAAKEQEQMQSSAGDYAIPKKAQLEIALQQLGDALRLFTEKYASAFEETSDIQVTLDAWDDFALSEDKEDLYMDLCAVKVHIQQHQRGAYEIRNKVSMPALLTIFERNRAFLEDPAHEDFKVKLSAIEQETLKDLYGGQRYKCPKISCEEFFRGFSDRRLRKKHVDKHDRPFRCEVRECPGELGFTSQHDLLKHQKSFHPAAGPDQGETFEPLESLVPKNETTAKWACPNCPKRFTRGFHLRNHIRTHSNERPFSCTECQKAFTRDYDRKRHEKTVHSRK